LTDLIPPLTKTKGETGGLSACNLILEFVYPDVTKVEDAVASRRPKVKL
jgi:hypothetical protein